MNTFPLKNVKSVFKDYEVVGGTLIVRTPDGRKRIGRLVTADTALVDDEFVDLLLNVGVSAKDVADAPADDVADAPADDVADAPADAEG